MLRHTVKVRRGHVAVADEQRSLTYADLQARVFRFANALRDGLGMSEGERFVFLAENRVEFVEAYFGAAAAGVVVVPINHRLSAVEIVEIVDDAEARVVIVESSLESRIAGLRDAGYDGRIVLLGDEDDEYEHLLQVAAASARDEPRTEAEVFLQMYTSGSTGRPKGVMLSHRNISANAWHLVLERSVMWDDRYLNSAPLSHLAAGARVFVAVQAGATHVVQRSFDPERVVQAMVDGTANATLLVPAMMRSVLDAAAASGTSIRGRVRQITYGAAPIPKDLLGEAIEQLECDFQQGYGLTEAGHNLTLLPPEDHRPNEAGEYSGRLASVGRETVGVHVRVVDDDDHDVEAGAVGEIIAAGPNIMEGYWRKPEETEAALRGGWLRSGDLGTVDEDGYVYLVDRKKDMLVTGGFNVYPQEIERRLGAHAAVREVAVVGAAHERWGEVPVAFIVATQGADTASLELDLDRICVDTLARYKQPTRYCFVDDLPRTSSGKVSKPRLRERLADDVEAPQ
jgi:long-chain acyl-CoA synthetase